jgi:hypothetical protein
VPTPPRKALEDLGLEDLRHRRAKHLRRLKSYAALGAFPHNHDFEGERRPYLMDRHGRLCAVGYLIAAATVGDDFDYALFMGLNYTATRESSAMTPMRSPPAPDPRATTHSVASALFQKLAAENNHIRVRDVKGGPILKLILGSGLTQEECALIQPGYSYLQCEGCLPGSESGGGAAFGHPTPDSVVAAEKDKVRIRAHLTKVLATLEGQTDASLATALGRLKG